MPEFCTVLCLVHAALCELSCTLSLDPSLQEKLNYSDIHVTFVSYVG